MKDTAKFVSWMGKLERPDGAKWRYLKTGKLELVLTAGVKDFMVKNRWLFTEIGKWSFLPVTKQVLQTTRKINKLMKQGKERGVEVASSEIAELEFIASGQNAEFFRIKWTKIWLRELKIDWDDLDPTMKKLERMDIIQSILESGDVPRWIHMPVHYWAILTPSASGKKREFLLIEIIDHGVTGEDLKRCVRNEPERFPGAHERVKAEFWDGDLSAVYETFERQTDEAISILDTSSRKHRENFRQLFTDFNRKNIVIQKLAPPVWWKDIWFWIIDQ